MQVNIYNNLAELYNKEEYHIEFLDAIAEIIPKELLNLYERVLELSLEAPFTEELRDSYQLAIELLCRALGFKFDIDGKINIKEV